MHTILQQRHESFGTQLPIYYYTGTDIIISSDVIISLDVAISDDILQHHQQKDTWLPCLYGKCLYGYAATSYLSG